MRKHQRRMFVFVGPVRHTLEVPVHFSHLFHLRLHDVVIVETTDIDCRYFTVSNTILKGTRSRVLNGRHYLSTKLTSRQDWLQAQLTVWQKGRQMPAQRVLSWCWENLCSRCGRYDCSCYFRDGPGCQASFSGQRKSFWQKLLRMLTQLERIYLRLIIISICSVVNYLGLRLVLALLLSALTNLVSSLLRALSSSSSSSMQVEQLHLTHRYSGMHLTAMSCRNASICPALLNAQMCVMKGTQSASSSVLKRRKAGTIMSRAYEFRMCSCRYRIAISTVSSGLLNRVYRDLRFGTGEGREKIREGLEACMAGAVCRFT